MAKIPVIIDCDPGHDDAIALLLAGAHPELDVQGVTVVAGNQTLAKTVVNTLKVLEYANLSWPVYAGSAKPLLREPIIAPEVHGESGLDGPVLPEPKRKPESQHAVAFIAETIAHAAEPVTLIVTGPMTNVASAILGSPHIVHNIREIVFMGGAAVGGNWTPAAEFNILVDPDAAHIVMESPVPKRMIGLDVTEKAMIYDHDIANILKLNNPVAVMAGELLQFFTQFHRAKGLEGSPLHDPLAVAAVLDPSLVKAESYPVKVERSGEYCVGRTVLDWNRDMWADNQVRVALDVDRQRFVELVVQSLQKYDTIR